MAKPKKIRVELYADMQGKWRTRFRARNGRIVFDSGQGYYHKADAIERVYELAESLGAGTFTIKDLSTGEVLKNGDEYGYHLQDDGPPQA